ncbi:MAG: dTDP-glucose pyrophosphorylase [Bacteroidia bacterium]|nr:dTDP-glucose pyrophosphorylase [Bacteroidia bacterium]
MKSINPLYQREIIGLIPAGGTASRLGTLPCSKELLPIGFKTGVDGFPRPKPVSLYLLEKYNKGGAEKTLFILRAGKWDIPAYYGDGRVTGMDMGYLIMDLPYGVPYTLDQAYPFVKHATVYLGFPDILFEPEDAFARLHERLEETGADLVAGLFEVRDQEQKRKSDMVAMDTSGNIVEINIKPKAECDLAHSWIIAAWTPVFTEFMHDFLRLDQTERGKNLNPAEIYLGHVMQAAIAHGLKVNSVFFPGHTFLDVGTPVNLMEAVGNPPT